MTSRSHIGNAVDSLLIWIAPRMTRVVAEHWGEHLGLLYVSEFPKSGATWLARMLADYTLIPFPQLSRLPIGMKAIIHNHWDYVDSRVPSVYVYRDGRDVMISLYFHLLNYLREGRYIHDKIVRRKYRSILGHRLAEDEIFERLPDFIEMQMTNPLGIGTKLSWPDHVTAWMSHAGVHYASYEGLLQDPAGQMEGILRFLGFEIDQERLQQSVARESFARRTKDLPGDRDPKWFLRKGIAGDWKNYFTPEAAAVFEHFGGGILRELGYESSPQWKEMCRTTDRRRSPSNQDGAGGSHSRQPR